MTLYFEIINTQGHARAGWLHTPHGKIPTPVFAPVGGVERVQSAAAIAGQHAAGVQHRVRIGLGHQRGAPHFASGVAVERVQVPVGAGYVDPIAVHCGRVADRTRHGALRPSCGAAMLQ